MEFSQQGIERYINQISHTLDTIINNFTYTNNEYTLIENLSKLQSNNYLKYLNYAIQNPMENTKYENIHKEFSDFQNIMLYLGKLLNKTYLEVYIVSDKFTIQLFEIEYNNFSESKKKWYSTAIKKNQIINMYTQKLIRYFIKSKNHGNFSMVFFYTPAFLLDIIENLININF